MIDHCPKLVAREWHQKIHIWQRQLFYQVHYWCFLDLPINLQTVVKRALARLDNLQILATPTMIFSIRENAWGGDLLISINKPAPGLEIRSLSGKFMSFLFTGDYGQINNWISDIKKYDREHNENFSELYIWHVTCPRCAQAYGQRQTIIFAKII